MSEDPLDDAPTVSNGSSPGVQPDDGVPQEPPQPVKRKGGRKPVYATLEERKQRNRQAQAAFRERRTEYIKQLEIAMKENEDAMEQLQQSNREVTEECHMLRYKTSLLEDLLYENGIDYQSELQSRSSKSLLGSPYVPQGPVRASWPQQTPPDAQRDKKQRVQMSPQKFKARAKVTNEQTMLSQQQQQQRQQQQNQQQQSMYLLPSNPSHRMASLSLQNGPTSPGQGGFNHANGVVNSMQPSFHRQGQQFDDGHVDPSISNDERATPYFPEDPNHMATYLGNTGPERFPDVSAYREQTDAHHRQLALPRPNPSQYRHPRPFASPMHDDQPLRVGNRRPRLAANHLDQQLYRQNSFDQSPLLGSELAGLPGGNDMPEMMGFVDDVMS